MAVRMPARSQAAVIRVDNFVMERIALDETLPLSDQIVSDAWRDFMNSDRPLKSVPAFLSWLGDNQPEVLRLVNEGKLVKLAARLHAAGPST
jgi:hypothetical protein